MMNERALVESPNFFSNELIVASADETFEELIQQKLRDNPNYTWKQKTSYFSINPIINVFTLDIFYCLWYGLNIDLKRFVKTKLVKIKVPFSESRITTLKGKTKIKYETVYESINFNVLVLNESVISFLKFKLNHSNVDTSFADETYSLINIHKNLRNLRNIFYLFPVDEYDSCVQKSSRYSLKLTLINFIETLEDEFNRLGESNCSFEEYIDYTAHRLLNTKIELKSHEELKRMKQ